jgi:threonine/homoserine/homoserine lactone efflux protein
MPDTATLTVFFVASLMLVATPGPAVMYVVARGLHQGRPAGLVSALGIEVGTLFHLVLATLGVSALLVSSGLAFTVVKYLGVAYLIALGIRTFQHRDHDAQSGGGSSRSLKRLFAHGVAVEILNPKTALFFIAYLPQFVDPEGGSTARQMLLLGALFIVIAIIIDSIYGLLSGTLSGWLRDRSRFLETQRYVSGCTYVLLALMLALPGAG